MENAKIRIATVEDTSRICELGHQLGYPNEATVFAIRFNEILSLKDHTVLVLESGSNATSLLVGVVHLKVHKSLFAPSALEVAGLVIDEAFRGHGFGKMLMAAAEEVALSWGLSTVRLTSNVHRLEAHQFYSKLGYAQPKTSHYFAKTLNNEDGPPNGLPKEDQAAQLT
jgi:GNAT superfamily N-acetyltransferase